MAASQQVGSGGYIGADTGDHAGKGRIPTPPERSFIRQPATRPYVVFHTY